METTDQVILIKLDEIIRSLQLLEKKYDYLIVKVDTIEHNLTKIDYGNFKNDISRKFDSLFLDIKVEFEKIAKTISTSEEAIKSAFPKPSK